MIKIPISGGPHTGKTTLLEALRHEFPDAYFVPEPATEVIEHELALHNSNPDYIPNVPWIDYKKFGPVVGERSVELEALIPTTARVAFQDRSLFDTIGYARLNNCPDLVPMVQRQAKAANYAFALFCEPVGGYATTDVRRETLAEAARTHGFLKKAYEESGIPIITLPPVSVQDRVALVSKALQNFTNSITST